MDLREFKAELAKTHAKSSKSVLQVYDEETQRMVYVYITEDGRTIRLEDWYAGQ